MPRANGQAWIRSARADLALVIAPPFVASAVVLGVPGFFKAVEGTPPWAWLLLVLGVDVAHVYGTLFKTYLDPRERTRRRALLWAIPVASWAVGALLYSWGSLTFWRALAYLAVFHFIRQQYGFVRIYSRKEPGGGSRLNRTLDGLAVYSATLYPLLYWHTHLPRKFNWFVDGDFLEFPARLSPWLGAIDQLGFSLFLAIQALYLARELGRLARAPQNFNVPKNLIVLGTVVSWYLGIVVFDGDLSFTLLNVVSHGLPYLGLVWLTERSRPEPAAFSRPLLGILIFLGIVLTCAYFEEAFWDALVWRDHPMFFAWTYGLPLIQAQGLLTLLVPLLSLPQIVHYVLDGLIWKVRDPNLLREMK